jgi:hypothetical protein
MAPEKGALLVNCGCAEQSMGSSRERRHCNSKGIAPGKIVYDLLERTGHGVLELRYRNANCHAYG